MFKSKRKEYKKISQNYSKKSILENKYYLLGSNYFKDIINNTQLDDKNLEFFYDLCKEWDDYGSIELDFGLELESLVKDKTYILGVHKTLTDAIIDEDNMIHSTLINTILDEGIKNFGDLSSGVGVKEAPEPSKTISPITNIMDAVIYLKSSYKNSDVCFLVALPREYVDNDLEFAGNYQKEIYNIKDNEYTIKPEYIVGLVYQNNGNCTYYSKDSIKEKGNQIEVI